MLSLSSSKNQTTPSSRRFFAVFFLAVFVLNIFAFVSIHSAKAEECYDEELERFVPCDDSDTPAAGGWVYDALLRAFAWVCDLILYLFSFLVALGGYLLDLALYITSNFGFTKSAIVQAGWTIIRDLANMFFSLVLLVIAFATILRIETYGMKQVLWRLVVAALLINFSLVIAGVIIDASNVLTKFFLSTTTGSVGSGVSSGILEGTKLSNFWKPTDTTTTQNEANPTAGASKTGAKGFMHVVLNTLLGVVLMLITAFVLLAAALLFYVRMVALWILLIFAPLAWLAMILPGTRSMWNKWWHNFIKYVIFAPVYAFFLYLALYIMKEGILTNNSDAESAMSALNESWKTGVGGFIATTFLESLSTITNYVILIIFLLAGLVFARSSGIAGANAVTNMGKSWGRTWSRWAAKGGAVPGASWAAKRLGISDKLTDWQKTGTGWRRGLANTLRGTGAVKRTAFAMMSPQSWSRAWAMRRQRADNEAFSKGAGRIDDFLSGFSSWKDIGKAYDARPKSEKEKIIEEEAKKIETAMQSGAQTWRTQNIGVSSQQLEEVYAKKGLPEPTVSMTPAEQQTLILQRKQAENEWIKEQSLAHAKTLYDRHDAQTSRRGLSHMFNQVFGSGMREQMADSQEVARRQAEFSQTMKDEDQIVHNYLNAKNDTDKEALFRLTASINGLNTLFARIGMQFNPSNLSQYIQQGFRKGRAEIVGADISAMASQNGNFSFVGTTAFNPQTGKIIFATPEQQKEISVRKALEMEPQLWARQIHPDSWINRDTSGKQTEISDFAKDMLNQMTAAHVNQIERFQGRTLTALYRFSNQLMQHANSITDPIQKLNAQNFVSKVRERYEKVK